MRLSLVAISALLLPLFSCSNSPAHPSDAPTQTDQGRTSAAPGDQGRSPQPDMMRIATTGTPPLTLRVATFNASLYRASQGQLLRDLQSGADTQATQVAQVIRRVNPDIILLNEFDWDADALAATAFATTYLKPPQGADPGIDYPYLYVPPTNTGTHSGIDLNHDGILTLTPGSQDYGNDSLGYGTFPGQYGMVVLSKYPIDTKAARTFASLLWKDMPQNLQPTDWYTPEAVAKLPLSSKNHVDLPIVLDSSSTLHLLLSHPTPPGFDGPEDRNGRRNHDEIRFWTDYLEPDKSGWIKDDAGRSGGLASGAHVVILGDLNADPADGPPTSEAIRTLLAHTRLIDPAPKSSGAVEKSKADGQTNQTHKGDPALDTADFSDRSVGNLRVDYALPSTTMILRDSAVFWPTPTDPDAPLATASDHHLVWVDLEVTR